MTQGKVGVYRNRLDATEGAFRNGKKIKIKLGKVCYDLSKEKRIFA